jgi:hypothetical protein
VGLLVEHSREHGLASTLIPGLLTFRTFFFQKKCAALSYPAIENNTVPSCIKAPVTPLLCAGYLYWASRDAKGNT